MRNKESFDTIVKIIEDSNDILIFPHILPDGDTIGSAAALYRALVKCGKKVYLVTEMDIPVYLDFLVQSCDAKQPLQENYDLCIAVDCSDEGRIGKRISTFRSAKTTVNIDHHPTNDCYADMNYVDDQASATGEIIFGLLKALNIDFDIQMAEAIYTAISTDTGSFKYTNTSSKTHLVAAELLDMGIDLNKISIELYQNTRIEKIKLEKQVLETLNLFFGGKVATAYVSKEMLKYTGATMDESEGFIELLRNIQNVEIAILFKEMSEEEIKVGLRAKRYADVSKIASQFGGGGHVKAAGCTVNDTLENAKKLITASAEMLLK